MYRNNKQGDDNNIFDNNNNVNNNKNNSNNNNFCYTRVVKALSYLTPIHQEPHTWVSSELQL